MYPGEHVTLTSGHFHYSDPKHNHLKCILENTRSFIVKRKGTKQSFHGAGCNEHLTSDLYLTFRRAALLWWHWNPETFIAMKPTNHHHHLCFLHTTKCFFLFTPYTTHKPAIPYRVIHREYQIQLLPWSELYLNNSLHTYTYPRNVHILFPLYSEREAQTRLSMLRFPMGTACRT